MCVHQSDFGKFGVGVTQLQLNKQSLRKRRNRDDNVIPIITPIFPTLAIFFMLMDFAAIADMLDYVCADDKHFQSPCIANSFLSRSTTVKSH